MAEDPFDVNTPRGAYRIRKWIRPAVAAGLGLIVVNLPGTIHAFLWPEWEWGDSRGLAIGPSYFASPILVWYTFHSIFRILFSRWSWARIASFSALLYLAAGAWVMGFMDALFGGGAPLVLRLSVFFHWPSWLTWIVTCIVAPGWCFIFD